MEDIFDLSEFINDGSTLRCINCEHEAKSSDDRCSCSECGFPMFAVPYSKKEKIISETVRFIESLKISALDEEDVEFYRNEEKKGQTFRITKDSDDENRFPSFEKIQKYICTAEKTEEFIERINKTLEKLKKHLHTEYRQKYKADFTELYDNLCEADGLFTEISELLSLNWDPVSVNLPDMILDAALIPDETLLDNADIIIKQLNGITSKMLKFIKQNNIYGGRYRKASKVKFVQSEENDYQSDLEGVISELKSINDKTYNVDIFSDGTEELGEMLKGLWLGIYSLLEVPVLKTVYSYSTDSGETLSESFSQYLIDSLSGRYEAFDTGAVKQYAYSHSESDLFELYSEMIRLDDDGILGASRSGILKAGQSEKKMNNLIGLKNIKTSVQKIKAYALSNKDADSLNLHMCFYGNPGTGKTEVARIIAEILCENNILPTDKVVETDRSGLVGQYLGETPQKTMEKIKEAMGGVLFIDEAYALVPKESGRDYGDEAIATLIKAMEDFRGKFCVILAGYRNEMVNMISANPGFKSRIQFELDFPNYDRTELRQITELMLRQRKYNASETALEKMLDITDVKRKEPNFANAREVRNILDQVIMCQNLRTVGYEGRELGLVDVNQYIKDSNINLPVSTEGGSKKILTGDEELDQLIGLDAVKRMIKKIRAYAKRNSGDKDFNLHMCFYGNPGTGKTEVARILSRILYDAGVLKEAKLVETNSAGLISKYVGETGQKTHEKVMDALGGVLFVDEAYALTTDKESSSFGDEAVAVLLKDMEDHRGQFCTVLAGYKKEIQDMLSSNPGFQSRIQFTLDFPDYTREELSEIAVKNLSSKKYSIDDDALDKLMDVTEYYRNRPNFANARTVRNIVDQVIMNQNLRAEDDADDYNVILSDVEEYIADEGIDLKDTGGPRKIGFV